MSEKQPKGRQVLGNDEWTGWTGVGPQATQATPGHNCPTCHFSRQPGRGDRAILKALVALAAAEFAVSPIDTVRK